MTRPFGIYVEHTHFNIQRTYLLVLVFFFLFFLLQPNFYLNIDIMGFFHSTFAMEFNYIVDR